MTDKLKWRLSVLSFFIVSANATAVYANSSWYWITKTKPIELLPFVAIMTIAIETLAINKFAKVNKPKKTLLVVLIANLLSFAVPYIFEWYNGIYDFKSMIEHTPSYMITTVFLLVTIAVEVPVVFLLLRKNSGSIKSLLISIIASNTLTTVLVAIIERVVCKGTW